MTTATQTKTAKQALLDAINKCADEATYEQLLAVVHLHIDIAQGLAELDAGHGIPHAEAMQRLAKWRN